ncbi:hypothetical protein BDZ45DRAFT_595527 [Acephala macrosclerotiorum]|nr:hypothetical protein BDZ45DRAFT_595527 [Acephala macrosclerotiorum]
MATVNVQRAQSPEAASSKVEPAFVDQSLIQKVTPIIFEELDKAELFGGFPRIETPYQPDVKDQGAAFSKDIHTSAGSQQSAVSRYNIPTDWTGGNCSLEAFRENSFRRVYDLSRSDDGAISAVSQTLVRTEVRTNQRVGLLGKRRRASKPKIKTGCITCITRRVKCDGSKPECLRCQKFGRRCEGYLQSSSQFRGLMQLQPRIPTLSLYSPSNTIHSTEEESRYFRTFSEHTATELPGYFEATFWTRLVLQESHNVPAIRHAVVALGAMTKSLETAPGPGLKVNVLQTADKKHHENAVLAHIKAIRELNRYISSSNSPQLRYALIACLLFVCFETFQGSQASSIQQTYGGLKLLQSYYLGKPGSRPWIPQRSEAKDAQSGHDTKDSIRRKSSTSISTATISSSSLNTNTKGQPFGQEVNTTLQKRQEDIPAASHHEIDHNSILSTYEPPLHVSASQVAEERPLLASSPTPQPLSNDLILEEILIQTLVRLDGQGLFFGLPPGIPPLIWDIYKVWHLPLPPTFPDFLSARRYWDFCMDRALQFYRRTLFNRNYSPDQSDLPNSIITQYMSFVDEITAFEKAFAPILAAAVSNDRFPAVENPAALVLSLYPKCTLILLSYISDSEMIFDVHFEDFEYIIRTCKLLLASEATTQLPKNTRFSFDVGIVPPLHLTATKCRDPVVRREAIDLLFQSPRQEGMWDGVLSARIGRWITTVEEEGLIPPTIPESFRHGARDVRTEGGYVEQEVKFNYPTPPHVMDYSGAESSTRNDNEDVEMVDVVREPTELGELAVESEDTVINEEPQNAAHDSDTNAGAKTNSKWSKDKEWVVPEGNRVKLVEVDFHIPDRYIKVKCQKVLTDQDGSRQERETVIAW